VLLSPFKILVVLALWNHLISSSLKRCAILLLILCLRSHSCWLSSWVSAFYQVPQLFSCLVGGHEVNGQPTKDGIHQCLRVWALLYWTVPLGGMQYGSIFWNNLMVIIPNLLFG
jgi:hypothetical protein